ncbi:MAG: DUF1553 domain-containing protein [Limisphaerales bacterium]
MSHSYVASLGSWVAALGILGAMDFPALAGPVDFSRDIRPILSENCYACHGPDSGKRKVGLRLDVPEGAFGPLRSGQRAVVAGDVERSGLIGRLVTPDLDDRMPPPETGKQLTPAQIEVLRRWVAGGAEWKEHWAYVPPVRPPVPPVADEPRARNELDAFLLARLAREGLKPAPEAGRPALIRRASLDLTGLPPTVEEVDAFLGDEDPEAYGKLVDRLLASRHFGERLAMHWLDLARFADTSGYHFDGVRFMWLWRDRLIEAFNENQRFDDFTVDQLAGDLRPRPTLAQRIASGFNRNNMTTDEGGADPDEYLNKYVVDRVNTTAGVWMGMTAGCAECHDHKYDRLTQKEFYQLYAFYHNVPEKGLDRIRSDNPPPRLPVPTPEQAALLVERDFALRDAEKTLQDRQNELGETQEKWEGKVNARPPAAPSNDGLRLHLAFDDQLLIEPVAVTAGDPVRSTAKIVGTDEARFVAGRLGHALQLDGKVAVEVESPPTFDRPSAFSLGAWVKLQAASGCVLSRMEKAPSFRGFDLMVSDSRLEVHLVHQWPTNAIKVRTKDALPQNQWLHVLATVDGSGKAAGVRLLVNGRPREVEVQHDGLAGSFASAEPWRIGARAGEAWFTGLIDDLRVYERALAPEEVQALVFSTFVPVIARTGGKRTPEEQDDLRRYYRETHAVDFLRSEAALSRARKARDELVAAIPTTMVMEEMEKPRDTFVLVRGDFREPGEKVEPGVPAWLPPLEPGVRPDRLALARWLMAPQHPLTARVTVNRYWSLFFGTGLVKTVNDFGSQGEWPSHPELLDWLACQFRDGGEVVECPPSGLPSPRYPVGPWNVKELVRLMVTSAAYRRSAAVTPEQLERDPENRLLTRGPRHRLDAELIRDNALAIGGLLNRRIGGPSVKPYQPPGIWDGTDSKYEQDHGEDLYRRGMYVFWRRSAHYPSFATFDAPSREVCTFQRQRTQTPLQSLVLMNDPVQVEAARGLAQRVCREEPDDLERRLSRAFRHALARPPAVGELAILRRAYEQQRSNFQAAPEAATKFLGVGESPVLSEVDPIDLAALMAVANVLLNLNETISN